ncbi:hypothetical protein [Clostridium cylindrosporum]|uniref:Uncharacterized protein n=1 Tax=Clostridium cylindrosporum DSM 605 TaxID=1121307 RepID=A0A0J8DBD2_CLOCY|nr:hypothetical protein [Clostridium cylindrosporum]KMT21598.1 hypothetical protein CLCY_2c03600 [Clostridium cylindrosporum DSM 605]
MPIPKGIAGEAILEKYFPSEEWENNIFCSTGELKAISDYTGLNFKEIESLTYVEYLLFKKDAWVFNLKQSENGQEFLKTLYRLRQTKADINAIRKFNERRG